MAASEGGTVLGSDLVFQVLQAKHSQLWHQERKYDYVAHICEDQEPNEIDKMLASPHSGVLPLDEVAQRNDEVIGAKHTQLVEDYSEVGPGFLVKFVSNQEAHHAQVHKVENENDYPWSVREENHGRAQEELPQYPIHD